MLKGAVHSWPLRWIILAVLCGNVSSVGMAVLRAKSGHGKAKNHGVFLAKWHSSDAVVTASPLVHPLDNSYGCRPQRHCRGCALLAMEGNCTIARKVMFAQAAGMKIIIVASAKQHHSPSIHVEHSSDTLDRRASNIVALMASKNTGRELLLAAVRETLSISCWRYDPTSVDLLEEAVVGLLAVALVVIGAWYGVEDLRTSGIWASSTVNNASEIFSVESNSGMQFIVVGSLMLTVLFFFMKYLIYLLLLAFATGAISTTTTLLEPIISKRRPSLREKKAYRIPQWVATILATQEDHTMADAISELSGVALALGFLVFQNNESVGWILQDVIGTMLLLTIQRTLRLPNLKAGVYLLACTFCFDIFWVFISPFFFKKSVMIEVATGAGSGQSVPMVLKIPNLTGLFPGHFKILGLGDIAVPGLLISLLLRHDLSMAQRSRDSSCWRRGYFVPGVIGYALGLLATFVSLHLMQHGQPALLFLVPGTLMPTCIIAICKGEFVAFWNADYRPEQPPDGYGVLPDGGKHA